MKHYLVICFGVLALTGFFSIATQSAQAFPADAVTSITLEKATSQQKESIDGFYRIQPPILKATISQPLFPAIVKTAIVTTAGVTKIPTYIIGFYDDAKSITAKSSPFTERGGAALLGSEIVLASSSCDTCHQDIIRQSIQPIARNDYPINGITTTAADHRADFKLAMAKFESVKQSIKTAMDTSPWPQVLLC